VAVEFDLDMASCRTLGNNHDYGSYAQSVVEGPSVFSDRRQHRRNSQSAKMCQHCGRFIVALNGHIKEVHRPTRLFVCEEEGCERKGGNGFGRKDNLMAHLRGVHGIDIPKRSRRKARNL
jgi:hypothetical protein